MSGGSYFELEWAIAAVSWTLYEDAGSGYVSRGTVTIPAGTRTTTGHLAALVAAISARPGIVSTYALMPWTQAPAGERPVQRWCIQATSSSATACRLIAGSGSDHAKLGLSGTTDSADLVLVPKTWIYGVWAPPLYSFSDDRPYKAATQSHTQTWIRRPLIIRHRIKTCRSFQFQYVPGRFVRGEISPNADSAQAGTQGTFEDMWAALSLGQVVRYWPDFDDASVPDEGDSIVLALESPEQAARLQDCLDPAAWAEFGRDAHHVTFEAFETTA